ncbi:MAG: hypothetical protein H8E41_02745 [Desulfobulbaceae bacterium]|uniref:Uncharacterized protein n=1 Tax=Candidatus Desulfobia pelagia TaxID=2841692 RepID=A0A8J6NDD7_9BACT|nr:hypothetical protein [Candidatus Desulfobia pelagia]
MAHTPLNKNSRVGIVGIPPLDIIRHLNAVGAAIFDLDEPIVKVDIETAAPHLPRVYCAILRTAVINALHLDLDAIYIDVGPGKCDCALHVSTIFKDIVSIPVYPCRNTDTSAYGYPLSRTRMSLMEKFQKITRGVQSAKPYDLQKNAPCKPVAGFWGVPPRDFSLFELFPDRTHVYGWTRCMENKTPADTALESYFNPEVPTVFFSQSFCAKTALAKFLAAKHPKGLYLDIDVGCSSSAKAKIQAFLELSGVPYDLG